MMKPQNTMEAPSAKGGETTLVGIWNLHVMVTTDDGSFFAQAFEIDYAAQGGSLDEVKHNFESGLCDTIHEHLKVFGSIESMIQPAPAEVWQELAKVTVPEMQHEYSQVSLHYLPFKNIEYILPKAA